VIHSVKYHGFDKLIVVNGHGGNTASIMLAISEYNDIHDMLCLLFEWWKDEDLIKEIFGVPGAIHADAVETSVVWAACPEGVVSERFEGLTSAEKWGREIGDLYLSSRTDQFTSTGIAGSLEGISKEKGQQTLDAAIKKLVNAAEELSKYKK
jgi:creatinine amidohydrolase